MEYSETPEVLVAKGKDGELSPNPASFGFTKQLFVDSLPMSGEVDVLYLVKVYNNGELIGYRPYKFTKTEGYVRIFNTNIPNLKAEDGGRETPVKVVNPPRPAFEKVFNGHVGFNKEPYIQGKPLHQWIDQEGGVTEEELQAALTQVYGKTVRKFGADVTYVNGTPTITTLADVWNLVGDEPALIYIPAIQGTDHTNKWYLCNLIEYGPFNVTFEFESLYDNVRFVGTNVAKTTTLATTFVTSASNSYYKPYLLESAIKEANVESGTLTQLLGYDVDGNLKKEVPSGEIAYSTEVPTAANTSGKLKVVVLDSDPATKYDGYLYLIEEE